MLSRFREPVSGFTHLFGAILSLIGMIILIVFSALRGGAIHITTFTIFGVSLILLYSASTTYHLATISQKGISILRKIDHSMIYVLIAGTYTPICLLALKGVSGWTLFTCVWVLAIVGIILKIFWFNAPRWLSTLFYVGMGWIAIFAVAPLARVVSLGGVLWLVAGGISYTIGAAIYGTKWPKITTKYFGFHEIFHIFVLIGSFCHYWLMFKYLLYIS